MTMDRSLDSARTFLEHVHRIASSHGELPPTTSLPIGGARAMSRLVLAHPAFGRRSRRDVQLRLFGATEDPELEALRDQSMGYLVGGALALGMTGHPLDELAPALVLAATSVDPESLLQRRHLLRDRPIGPPVPLLDDWLDKYAVFRRRACFAGVIKAVVELGKWAGQRSTADATGITGIVGPTLCGGNQITIVGTGFGTTQPADTSVYVPVVGGGCRPATVGQWADNAITVTLPPDVSAGCVGFVRGFATYQEPQQVTGELSICIGAAAEIWTKGFGKVTTPVVPCPPCLPGGQNRIYVAGPPVINTFRFTPAHVAPGGQPVLSWDVTNATSAQIAKVSGNGPALALANPLPLSGSITLPPVGGLVPVTGRYRLTASSACGSRTADAEFTMTRTPTLSILRIEAVQAIQKTDKSVRLTANRRTAVRVFVDSGMTDGFDLGFGPNRAGGLTGTVYAENVATGATWSCGPPWPVNSTASPAPNRDLLGDALNFDVPLAACNGTVRLRAVIEMPSKLGQPPLSWTTSSVTVSFTPKPTQEMLPLLITDPSSTSPAPTMADLFANLRGPAAVHPFPENGFVLNPPLLWTLGPLENLKSGIVWSWLVAKIAATIFLFPSTPVGGIRTGVVPNDPLYPWGGMALPRVGATAPSFISVAGNPGTFAHELAHAYGLLHANSCGPAGPYGALPLTISDPGLDVVARSILPAGTSELMSYCRPQWPSIEHWDYIFDRIAIS